SRPAVDIAPPSAVTNDASGFPILPPSYRGIAMNPKSGAIFISAQNVSSAQIAQLFEPKLGRPILDETGLTGDYDFKLHSEWMTRGTDPVPSGAPTPFTALKEQLGLELESATRPLNHLVVDYIDREPTEN